MRTFLAIEPPLPVQTLIRQTQQALEQRLAAAQQSQAVRWTAPAAVHLTLRFLGETTDEQRRLLHMALPALVSAHPPFTVQVQGLGCFPTTKIPSIIWLGLHPADQTLFRLQAHLEQAAQAAGFAAERKAFQPHLTIGRLRQNITRPQQHAIGQLLAHELASASRQPAASFVVNRLVHLRSELEPTGARYTLLQTFQFSEAAGKA